MGLVILALSVYLPGFWSIPPVDRDESRFAQASRQMFESVALPVGERDPAMHSGGLVIPMVQGKARLNKPPGIYWLQVASAWVFTGGDPLRDAIWMYRVPSLIAGLVTVLVTWRIGVSMFDARAGWLGGALLAVSPVFVWEAHQARADQVMVAATVVGVWGLSGVVRGERRETKGRAALWGWAVLMWVAVGAGVMVKGPVTPMVVGLTAVGYSVLARDWRWLRRTRPMMGLMIVAAMVGPWLWAVGERVGWDVYTKTVYDEVIGRSGEAKEGHWGPPGYHAVFMLVLFWPGCMMAGLGVWRAWRRARRVWRDRGRGGEGRAGRPPLRAGFSSGFLLAWLLPSWIVFELVMTKLPHYTMPMYPALALLSARAVFAAAAGNFAVLEHWLPRLGMALWFCGLVAVPGVAAILAGGFSVLALHQMSGWTLLVSVIACAAVMAASTAVILLALRGFLGLAERRQFVGIQLLGVAAIAVLSIVALQFAAPSGLDLSPNIEADIKRIDPGGTRPVAAVLYHEDSLVFLLRGRLERIDPDEVPGWIAGHPRGLVVLPLYEGIDESWGLQDIGEPGGTNFTSRFFICSATILEAADVR